MIPRHQTVLFVILLLTAVTMGGVLWNQLRRAHERLLLGEVAAPTQAPQVAPVEQATLMVASDADNSVAPRILTLPLPQNPEARARAVAGGVSAYLRKPVDDQLLLDAIAVAISKKESAKNQPVKWPATEPEN